MGVVEHGVGTPLREYGGRRAYQQQRGQHERGQQPALGGRTEQRGHPSGYAPVRAGEGGPLPGQ
ncbi:hypothetical protein DLJ46_06805, partial [Micromonospora globispora]